MSEVDALRRLEDKVDKLTEAVVHLARIDERQISASKDMGALQTRMDAVEKLAEGTESLLRSWINRGIGAWLVVVAAVSLGVKFIAFK